MIICGGSERKKSTAATAATPGRPGDVASFVWTVWTMVTNEEETLIAWSPDGDCVVFADPSRFAAEVCPRYFRHSKWISFTNRMNEYDFHKCPKGFVDGPNRVAFRHAHFRRGAEGELHRIEKKKWTPATPATPGRPGDVASFVWTVWTMVTNEEETLIAWSPDGDCVVFADPSRFAAEVCPRYFRHSKWTSFWNRMNEYDFHKCRNSFVDGSNRVAFRHAHFRRGAESCCA